MGKTLIRCTAVMALCCIAFASASAADTNSASPAQPADSKSPATENGKIAVPRDTFMIKGNDARVAEMRKLLGTEAKKGEATASMEDFKRVYAATELKIALHANEIEVITADGALKYPANEKAANFIRMFEGSKTGSAEKIDSKNFATTGGEASTKPAVK